MEKNDKYFYLEKLFPDTSEIISNEFKSIQDIKDDCLFVLDTNILLMPYKTSKNSLNVFASIYNKLKEENALRIPERVIREFGKNRGKNLSEVYKYLSQKENSFNRLQLDFDIPQILSEQDEYKELMKLKKKYHKTINEIKTNIQKLHRKVYDYNWDDPVSELYKEIISPEIITPVLKKNDEIINDLEFRIHHSIAPGFKDSKKSDRGIGDLIIWQTIKEIGVNEKKDIIYVTDDSKNDWFYVEERKPVYPRYELLYEFKKETNKTIHIIDITDFLVLFDADKETINEVTTQKLDINEEISWVKIPAGDLEVGMEVIHRAKPSQSYKGRKSGIITKIDTDPQLGYIVSLLYEGADKLYLVATINYNWWRKVK